MCVIALSGEGIDMPTEENIKKMFKTNPDGAGYAILGFRGKLLVRKGFMKVEDLLDDLKDVGKRVNLKDHQVALHFRIGTSGHNDAATTHPYIISKDFAEQRTQSYIGDKAILFHNGVFPGYKGMLHKDSNDTQDFTASIGTKFLLDDDIFNEDSVISKVVPTLISPCRVLVFYPKKRMSLRWGQWHEKDGIHYSNMNWNTSTAAYSFHGNNTFTYPEKDTWGCWRGSSIWPGYGKNWIACPKERMMTILESLTKVGSYRYKSKLTKEEYTVEWKSGEAWLYNDAGKKDIEAYEAYMNSDDKEWLKMDDEWVTLDEEEIVGMSAPFVLTAKTGKKFFVDTVMCEGYTSKGLRLFFGEDRAGYIRSYLRDYGVLPEWAEDYEYERNAEELETKLLGSGIS